MVIFRWLVVAVLAAVLGGASGGDVTYDGRSLIIDGQRKLLFSGSIHYPRSTPDMWPSLISKAKAGGLDAIDTYVFWNLHEPKPGQFYMKNFTTKIVNMMKSNKLYASQGGPIILSQIENEYQNVEKRFGKHGPPYVRWAAAMAVGLKTGVPWVMCKQNDAPDPVINACNGFMCGETFVGPNSPKKPAIWTENWTHFYDLYGSITRIRSAEDIAYHAALFIVKMNGSFINYYMYHGGTNFGHTASAFVITSYYDQAPLDEYGLIRQPKWGHLQELHAAVKLCSQTLLYGSRIIIPLGPQQEAYVYSGKKGQCAAFLVNTNIRHNAEVQFRNGTYQIPRHSISILPDCKTVVFNTAKVSARNNNTRTRQPVVKLDSPQKWEEYDEVIPVFDDTSRKSHLLLEQMKTTKDTTDYLWYTASFEQDKQSQAVINVASRGHVLRAFVNGALIGSGHGTKRNSNFRFETKIALKGGVNNISLLSNMVGLPDSGAFMERAAAGLETVSIHNDRALENLIDNNQWGYQVGLLGERLQIYTEKGSIQAQWRRFNSSSKPLKWYKTTFDSPGGFDPVALNLGTMGKGEVWINGESIGRYWISFLTPAATPSQIWYHIPRSFLRPTGNLLVLFEEEEIGNPLGITVDTVSVTKSRRHFLIKTQ
ncbi:Beta-galactosidase 16 [Striga hermonthica]|uniref:Beta-galactosidase n=1 Tax=Striga hermonthica TaxID=68872 RepID=A0A9N7NDG1_STRHE|nr:Beta-galactosidase 16 [Striga hermonthica]